MTALMCKVGTTGNNCTHPISKSETEGLRNFNIILAVDQCISKPLSEASCRQQQALLGEIHTTGTGRKSEPLQLAAEKGQH